MHVFLFICIGSFGACSVKEMHWILLFTNMDRLSCHASMPLLHSHLTINSLIHILHLHNSHSTPPPHTQFHAHSIQHLSTLCAHTQHQHSTLTDNAHTTLVRTLTIKHTHSMHTLLFAGQRSSTSHGMPLWSRQHKWQCPYWACWR